MHAIESRLLKSPSCYATAAAADIIVEIVTCTIPNWRSGNKFFSFFFFFLLLLSSSLLLPVLLCETLNQSVSRLAHLEIKRSSLLLLSCQHCHCQWNCDSEIMSQLESLLPLEWLASGYDYCVVQRRCCLLICMLLAGHSPPGEKPPQRKWKTGNEHLSLLYRL